MGSECVCRCSEVDDRVREGLRECFPELEMFSCAHMPERLRSVAQPFERLAWGVAGQASRHPVSVRQAGRALELLWEAKNRAVLARVLADYRREREANPYEELPLHVDAEGDEEPELVAVDLVPGVRVAGVGLQARVRVSRSDVPGDAG